MISSTILFLIWYNYCVVVVSKASIPLITELEIVKPFAKQGNWQIVRSPCQATVQWAGNANTGSQWSNCLGEGNDLDQSSQAELNTLTVENWEEYVMSYEAANIS